MKSNLALSLVLLCSFTTGSAFAQWEPVDPCPVGTLIDTPTKKVKAGNYMGYFAKAEYNETTGPGGKITKTIDICLNNQWARAYEAESDTTIQTFIRNENESEQKTSTTSTQKMYAMSLENPGQLDPVPYADNRYTNVSSIITRMVPDLNGQPVAAHEDVTYCSHYLINIQRFLNQPSITVTHDASAETHDLKGPNNASYQKKAEVSTEVKKNGTEIWEVSLGGDYPVTTSGVRVKGSGYRGANDNDKGDIDIRIAAPNDGGDFPNKSAAQWSTWINGAEHSTTYPPAVLQQHVSTMSMVLTLSIDSSDLFSPDQVGPLGCEGLDIFAEIGTRIILPPEPPLV